MSPSKKTLLALATLAALAGCGGGGGGSDPAPAPVVTPTALSGSMIDGYVAGATVFCDLNNNGIKDANEVSVTTDGRGRYTFDAGCAGTLVGTGGTNVDTGFAFTGQLKAPAGASVMTPLTTLVASSAMTPAQLATLLGLPAGTDITKIDVADGNHADLLKKTLAVHQIVDSLTKVLAASGATESEIRAKYAAVAAGIAASLAAAQSGAAPLFSSTGDVNTTLVSSVVKGLPEVRALNLATADLDAACDEIAGDAQSFSKATDEELRDVTKKLQDPVKPHVNVTATTSYLSLADESFSINGAPVTLTQFGQGSPASGLQTIGLQFAVTGTPSDDMKPTVALELVERGGSGRKLQMMIEPVGMKLTSAGKLAITVPDSAKVYVYGHAADGTDINMTISDLSFTPISVVDNAFTLHYANLVSKVLASSDNTTQTTAQKFIGIKGSFAVKAVVSRLNLRHVDGSALTSGTITVTNSSKTVTGPSVSGVLTIN